MSTDKNTIKWYDDNAQRYTAHVRDANESIYHSYYEKPAMQAMLPDLHGKSVLSIGCGSGEDVVYMAKQGALRSVGVDISEQLIKIAAESYVDCEFQVMDSEKLTFNDNSFDFVYSSLAIHYLEYWTTALKEAYRVLKPNSYFLFSCHHPLDSALFVSQDDGDKKITQLARIKNKKSKEVEIIGDYMSHRMMTGTEDFGVVTWHKSLSEIVGEIKESGFQIDVIVEPLPVPELKDVSRRTYDTLVKIPKFLIFKLYKSRCSSGLYC